MLRSLVVPVIVATAAAFMGSQSSQAQDADAAKAILEEWQASPHADATSESFTHWNEEGEIPADCATCHSGIGVRDFLGVDGSAFGVIDHPVATGAVIDCEACHNEVARELSSVTFPSGAVVSEIDEGAICMVCHQGRQSTQNVNEVVESKADDEIDAEIRFVNIHYRAAAATNRGTEVKGGYEYDGKSYMGQFEHVAPLSSCTDCHDPHSLTVAVESCSGCHNTSDLRAIRSSQTDFDGNGDMSEGIAAEIDRFRETLGDAIQNYSVEIVGTPAIYADAYPYFFNDSNADGAADTEEAVYPNRYQSWTPRMLKAAYNYQFVTKDPGAYAHNPHYALQLLFDSIESLSERVDVDMSGLTRP